MNIYLSHSHVICAWNVALQETKKWFDATGTFRCDSRNNRVSSQFLGKLGEYATAMYFERENYFVERNFLLSRRKEADIYLCQNNKKFGIEVKSCMAKDWVELGRCVPIRQFAVIDRDDVIVWCVVPIIVQRFDPGICLEKILPNGINVEIMGWTSTKTFCEHAIEITKKGLTSRQIPVGLVKPIEDFPV